ncbi:fungal hydrophobin [Phlegmacium glaucopus]|nr:fungal hydrophobin [Phlegmacium glaucopus]
MQFKVISALAFATLVAAIATPPNTPSSNTPSSNVPSSNTPSPSILPPFPGNPPPTIGASKCETGKLHCCKSTQLPTAPAASAALGPLGISADTISGFVGITCTSITVTGGSNSCSAQPVCCTDNSFGGVVSLGCNPVNLSL